MHDLLYQVHCQCEATYNTGSRHKYLTEPNRKKKKKKHKQINNLTDLLVAVKKKSCICKHVVCSMNIRR